MGAVTNIVKRYVPASYRALVGATNNYYSMTELQGLADSAQYRLFATIAGSSNEASVYNSKEVDLLGIITTLNFIPAAIDYWGDQLASQNTSGTNEDVAYFDRRPELWKVYAMLEKQAADLSDDLNVNIKKIRASLPQVSYGDDGRGVLLTPDPQDFPASYDEPIYWTPWRYL